MAKIEDRFLKIVYKKESTPTLYKNKIPKSKEIIFFISEELKKEDFKEPFFNTSQVVFLGNGFKFLTYCGKEQTKNINKNALVIEKKIKKDNLVIYRCYLMDKERFNIRELFLKHSRKPTIKEMNYSLNIRDYIDQIKERYNKTEISFIINKILMDLTDWSLTQK
jgi:hypothetical protein